MYQSLINLFSNKCPVCGTGTVFQKKFFSFKNLKMNESCSHCNYKFVKEPGFFFGAMYVSYALGVIEALLAYAIIRLFTDTFFSLNIFLTITSVIIIMAFYNLRISRLIWIYIFKPKNTIQ